MVDQKTSTIYVMGGVDPQYHLLSSTEKLKVNDVNRKCKMASYLKRPLDKSAAVSSRSNEFIGYLVSGSTYNGRTTKIFGLRRSDQQWIRLSQRLWISRYHHTAVNVC